MDSVFYSDLVYLRTGVKLREREREIERERTWKYSYNVTCHKNRHFYSITFLFKMLDFRIDDVYRTVLVCIVIALMIKRTPF
jgi:hypothetical protein